MILNGQANLLQDVKVVDDLAQVRILFDKLEMRSHATQLMQSVISADGLQIFIGSEHDLFTKQAVRLFCHLTGMPIEKLLVRLASLDRVP